MLSCYDDFPSCLHSQRICAAPSMTVSTLLAILLALVLVLTLDATAALAKHYNCFWKAHEGSPGAFNYTLFCRGQMVRDNSDANLADWVCAAGNVGSLGTKIADWSRLRKNILELGKSASLLRLLTSLMPVALTSLCRHTLWYPRLR